MKLLIVSHTCVNPAGQQFYAEVERQTGWQLTIVTPELWKDEYGNKLNTERWPGYRGGLLSFPVWKSGSIPLHTYRSSIKNPTRSSPPKSTRQIILASESRSVSSPGKISLSVTRLRSGKRKAGYYGKRASPFPGPVVPRKC